jgi:hypothetical protein
MKKNLLIILLLFFLSCLQAQTVWNGPVITFSKAAFANPALPANQDRITSATWITRANTRGIYNAVTETIYVGNLSPANTEWATGTLANYASLTYQPWEIWAGGPPNIPNIVGVQAVVHLISENIYIGIKFTGWGVSGSGGGSFSYERTTPGVTTPVKLASFSAAKAGSGIELNWRTVMEENTASFLIERSSNGRDFTTVGSVAASGYSSSERQYHFTDYHPLNNNFYRLQTVDRDGQSSHSNVVAFRIGKIKSLDVFPTPASNVLNIQLRNAEQTNVQLIDVSGIVRKTVAVPAGENAFQLYIGDLLPGMYVVRAGEERKVVIKQ